MKDEPKSTPRPARQPDAAKPLRKELNQLDNRLGVLFAEREALEAALVGADVAPAQRAESGKRREGSQCPDRSAEGRWLELSTKLDDIAESIA